MNSRKKKSIHQLPCGTSKINYKTQAHPFASGLSAVKEQQTHRRSHRNHRIEFFASMPIFGTGMAGTE